MQPKSATKKKDPTPILFSSPPISPLKSPIKSGFEEETRPKVASENSTLVYLEFVETNNVKIKTKLEFEQQAALTSELSFKKREHSFAVNKDDIKESKYLRSNYLPANNVIEIPISVNTKLPHPSFETIQRIIFAIVEKEKKKSTTFPLQVDEKNFVEMFAGACLLNLDELAIYIYQTIIKPKLNNKLLVITLLITLECSFTKLYMELYKIFREYWISADGWSEPSDIASKVREKTSEDTVIEYKDETFKVVTKGILEFGFPAVTLKKPFETYRRDLYRQFFSPEQKYFTLNVKRRRNVDNNDGIFESGYPHRYYLVNQQKNEIILTATRHSEYGDFHIFGKEDPNMMVYGCNYVGSIIANAWGTGFELFDDGIDEDAYKVLPKYLCVLRTKIASIGYDTNFLGDVPREIKVDFLDFAEKTNSKLVPMPPKYDEQKDCYTLNFYGKAQMASARNFILTFPDNKEVIVFLQGKSSKDVFNVDFRHPLNFVQAFSISLCSIGKKLCVS